MKAIVITSPGGPEVLQIEEVENPKIGDGEVLIKVEAAALNRADAEQRKGSYPIPKGTSPYPGLECSGTVESVGKDVSRWKIGDQVWKGAHFEKGIYLGGTCYQNLTLTIVIDKIIRNI